MASLSEIARSPHEALKNLERSLGVEEGTLMREMQQFADGIGDWTRHIPYTLASTYYDNPGTRDSYQPHVDGCDYCQRLLELLHATDVQAAAFSADAVRMRAPVPGLRRRCSLLVLAAIAASVLITSVVSLYVVPRLQSAGLLPSPTSRATELPQDQCRGQSDLSQHATACSTDNPQSLSTPK